MNGRPWWLFLAMALTLNVRAAEPQPLLGAGDKSVTFKLQNGEGEVPQLVLFSKPEQADTAASINYWRGTPGLKDPGVIVQFKGLRFLRSEGSPDALIVRLVGIKNELELNTPISLADLESGNRQEFHFGPVEIGAAGIISGTTDAVMELTYDPQSRKITIPKVSGSFEWKRILYDAQSDAGSLTDVSGEVGELPPGGAILKAPEE